MNAHHFIIREQIRWTLSTFCRVLRDVSGRTQFAYFVQVEYGRIISCGVTWGFKTFSCGVMISNKICSVNMVRFPIDTGKGGPIFLVVAYRFWYILKDMETLRSTMEKNLSRLGERGKKKVKKQLQIGLAMLLLQLHRIFRTKCNVSVHCKHEWSFF